MRLLARAALLCALVGAPTCTLIVGGKMSDGAADAGGGSAGGSGGGSAGGAAGGSGGGSAGGSAGGSGGDAGPVDDPCNVALWNPVELTPTSIDAGVSNAVFHSAAGPVNGEKPVAAVAFSIGTEAYLVLGTPRDSSLANPLAQAAALFDVGGNDHPITGLAVGPGRTVGGVRCASVLGVSSFGTFLSGPVNCWNSEALAYSGISDPNGIALGGITSPSGDLDAGMNLIIVGTQAHFCSDRSYPNCTGIAGPTVPALPDGGSRVLDAIVDSARTTHWLLATNSADGGAAVDLTVPSNTLTIEPNPVSTAVLSAASKQWYVQSAFFGPGVDGGLVLFSIFRSQDLNNPSVSLSSTLPSDPDLASLHTMPIDERDGGTTLRAVWTSDGGVYFADLPVVDGTNTNWGPAALDSCSRNIAFAAPLNRDLIFTVDQSGNARVHRVPNGPSDGGL